MAPKKKATKRPTKSYAVLLTKLAGRKQPWCPEGWFLPTFDHGEALGFVALGKTLPTAGLPLVGGVVSRLYAQIASWEELYPDNTWKYEAAIVDGAHTLRFPLEIKSLR